MSVFLSKVMEIWPKRIEVLQTNKHVIPWSLKSQMSR